MKIKFAWSPELENMLAGWFKGPNWHDTCEKLRKKVNLVLERWYMQVNASINTIKRYKYCWKRRKNNSQNGKRTLKGTSTCWQNRKKNSQNGKRALEDLWRDIIAISIFPLNGSSPGDHWNTSMFLLLYKILGKNVRQIIKRWLNMCSKILIRDRE